MPLSGLHLLLTYQCNFECDHCFVWGSPNAKGTMTLAFIQKVIADAQDLGAITQIYFEGGEPFLYYPIMIRGLREAVDAGYKVGIVTNAYWATSQEDAEEWLRPIAEIGIDDLSLSSDLYHGSRMETPEAVCGRNAAIKLGIPVVMLQTCGPLVKMDVNSTNTSEGDYDNVMFKGRAAEKLTPFAKKYLWSNFTKCPFEDLKNPERVHIDPQGFVHVCQGITIGNLMETSLSQIMSSYKPQEHPIIGPLLKGGPVELITAYNIAIEHENIYADACHLCYYARTILRSKFSELAPHQMYYGTSENQKITKE